MTTSGRITPTVAVDPFRMHAHRQDRPRRAVSAAEAEVGLRLGQPQDLSGRSNSLTSAWKRSFMQAMCQVSNFVGTENIGLAAGGTNAALDGIDWLTREAGSGSSVSVSGYMCLRIGLC
jgi:hypothetical protein